MDNMVGVSLQQQNWAPIFFKGGGVCHTNSKNSSLMGQKMPPCLLAKLKIVNLDWISLLFVVVENSVHVLPFDHFSQTLLSLLTVL